MNNEIKIPVCKCCGRELGQFITPDWIICSSDYIPDNPYCMICQIEHCLQTNCFGCEMGRYPNCRHIAMKRFYLEDEQEGVEK